MHVRVRAGAISGKGAIDYDFGTDQRAAVFARDAWSVLNHFDLSRRDASHHFAGGAGAADQEHSRANRKPPAWRGIRARARASRRKRPRCRRCRARRQSPKPSARARCADCKLPESPSSHPPQRVHDAHPHRAELRARFRQPRRSASAAQMPSERIAGDQAVGQQAIQRIAEDRAQPEVARPRPRAPPTIAISSASASTMHQENDR